MSPASFAGLGRRGALVLALKAMVPAAVPFLAAATPPPAIMLARPSRVLRLCTAWHAAADVTDAHDSGAVTLAQPEFDAACDRLWRLTDMVGACPARTLAELRAKATVARRIAAGRLEDDIAAEAGELAVLHSVAVDLLRLAASAGGVA